MTEIQIQGTTTHTLFDIGTELDDVHSQFYRIINLLYIFDEHLEGDLDFLKRSNDVYAKHFLKRYEILHSMMDVIQISINEASDNMQQQIDAIYETDRKAQSRSPETE